MRRLFEGGVYSRVASIRGNTVIKYTVHVSARRDPVTLTAVEEIEDTQVLQSKEPIGILQSEGGTKGRNFKCPYHQRSPNYLNMDVRGLSSKQAVPTALSAGALHWQVH